MIHKTLSIPPLSINKAFQGKRFKTREYKQWEKLVLFSMPKCEMIKGFVKVSLVFYLKHSAISDIDNPIKTILDIIVKKGWIEDDRKIVELNVIKKKSKEPKIEVKINEIRKT